MTEQEKLHDELMFRTACNEGNEQIVDYLLSLTGDQKINIHAKKELGFRSACIKGHHIIVKKLLKLKDDGLIEINHLNNQAFKGACSYGHLVAYMSLCGCCFCNGAHKFVAH